MALSAFDAKSRRPSDADLAATLGSAYASWTELLAAVALRIDAVRSVWHYTSARFGWSLRLVRKGRVLVYLTPQERQFLVSFALGERAAAAAHAAKLPATIFRVVDAAPRYAEGRGVRFTVKGRRPVPALAKLTEIKCAH